MTETEVNIPLLRKAVEWAEAEAVRPAIEREWNQWGWITSGRSLAADILDDVADGPEWGTAEFNKRVTQVAAHCGTAYCIAGYIGQALDARYAATETVDGVHVSEFAALALGIAYGGENDLFAASNSIADVRRIAEDIAGERL